MHAVQVIDHLFLSEMFDMKTKYDESENIMIRATRTFTDKVTDIFGKSNFSLVLLYITGIIYYILIIVIFIFLQCIFLMSAE